MGLDAGGGRRLSGLDEEHKRGCQILDLILGGPFPGRRRRFREPIAQHCGTKEKAPGLCRGLLLVQQGCCLPAGLEAGSATRAGGLAAKDVTGGDQLDPKRTVAFVVRGGTGLAQRIQAVLRRTRGCGGESRQLEHHPRTGMQFRHAEGQGRPFGGYLVLGACVYVGCTGDGEILAVDAENGYWRRRLSDATSPCTNTTTATATTASASRSGASTTATCSRTRGSSLCARSARPSTTSSSTTGRTAAAASRSTAPSTAAGANIHPPDITLAHISVPGGFHLAGFVGCDSAVD